MSVDLEQVAMPDRESDADTWPASNTARGYCNAVEQERVASYNTPKDQLGDRLLGTPVGFGEVTRALVDLFANDVEGVKTPQLGRGGRCIASNSDPDGFATWRTWERFITTEETFACLTDEIGHGSGDINDLAGATAPLPAAGWLSLAGVGGTAAPRRKPQV